MNEFYIEENKYSYMMAEEAIGTNLSFLDNIEVYKKSKYLDLGSGFDIETTNFYDKSKKRWLATMWCWQWSFDEVTVIGRTWEEFKKLAYMIAEKLNLSKNRKMVVLDHNLPFEWAFMRKYLPIDKVLSKTRRDIMTFTAFGGMEWRDTAILTRFSLAKMATNYHLGIEKLKGDLDYNLIRHTKTPFQNKQEIAYCINDVQILQRFFHKYIKKEYLRMGYKIPLTQTGIPRFALKRALRKAGDFTKRYRAFIERAYPTEEFYQFERRYLFRGGFNHANILIMDDLFDDDMNDPEMGSEDIKSSYPYEIWSKKFGSVYLPMDNSWFDEVKDKPEEFFQDVGFIVLLKIKNIKSKTPHSIESKHKLIDYSEDAIFDNGRLVRTGENGYIIVGLLETDWLNYRDFYDMGEIEVIWIKKTIKQFLPDFIVKTVYNFFVVKETMPKDSVEYMRSKEKLNSIFGCMSTGLNTSDYILWNGELYLGDSEELPEDVRQEPKTYEEAIKKQFMLPIWACQVASFGRRHLLRLFKAVGYDGLYGDTDSCKIRHYKKYLPIIEKMNAEAEALNKASADRLGLNFDYVRNLGKFEFEGEYKRFKTLGAKRYLYETKPDPKSQELPKIVSVVAGMKKGTLLKHCEAKYDKEGNLIREALDPFEAFSNNLTLSPEESGKITSAYTDEAFIGELTDYLGNTEEIHEESCCALYAIPFKMKIDPDFIALSKLLKKQEERKREVYHGIL